MLPFISIVMPARNEGDRVARAILSFSSGRSHRFPLEFIVVDDASDDGCCDGLGQLLSVEKDAAWITVLRLDRWSGIPYSRNRAAELALSPVLFITDSNVEACPGWDIPLTRMLRPGRVLCATIADMASSWHGYGCRLQLPSMGVEWLGTPDAFNGDVPICPCAGTIIHKETYLLLGGYDTAMPVYGAAEPEFSVRAWLCSVEIVACPELVLRHRFKPEGERKPFIKSIESLQIRNYLRFGILYLEGKRLDSMLNYYSGRSPVHFDTAIKYLKADPGLMRRKRHLKMRLLKSFDWYEDRFCHHIRLSGG